MIKINNEHLIFIEKLTKPIRVLVGLIVIVFSFCSLGISGSNSGADFLKIPVSAREMAMGSAFSASASGGDAFSSNIAGISRLEGSRNNLGFTHVNLFDEESLNQITFKSQASSKNNLTWGVSALRLGYPDQERRDSNREVVGTFGASDLAVGAALGFSRGPWHIGSQIKFIRQDLAGSSAQGIAMDLGAMGPTGLRNLSWGASVRNLGPSLSFKDESFALPLSVSVGTAFQMGSVLTLTADIHSRPYQDQVVMAVGTEVSLVRNFFLRAGYLNRIADAVVNRQSDESNRGTLGSIGGLSGGLGLRMGRLQFDYAFAPFGELGDNQLLTMSLGFGGSPISSDRLNPKNSTDTNLAPAPLFLPVESDPFQTK